MTPRDLTHEQRKALDAFLVTLGPDLFLRLAIDDAFEIVVEKVGDIARVRIVQGERTP